MFTFVWKYENKWKRCWDCHFFKKEAGVVCPFKKRFYSMNPSAADTAPPQTRWVSSLPFFESYYRKKQSRRRTRYSQRLICVSCFLPTVWPDAGLKKVVFKSCLNKIQRGFYINRTFSKRPKGQQSFWVTFESKFLDKNFQKSPNLVTLPTYYAERKKINDLKSQGFCLLT